MPAAEAASHPQVPVSSLRTGSPVESVYHLVALEQRSRKGGGEPYFTMQLADATGTIQGIMWDGHAALVSGIIVSDDFVRVQAEVGEFNGNPQLNVRKVARVEEAEIDLSAFIPASPRPRDEMERELDEWIAKVKNPDCQRLLQRLFGHKRLRELYCTAPAAAKVHQAYLHGLLEHTLMVVGLADSLAKHYEPVDRDLLITGALLHDIGKVRELSWKRTITYTTEGRLLGHIPMGASMVDAAIQELRRNGGFDQDVQMHLLHLILSHHGKQEWGSPVTPKTREAIVLHYADHTEAYMQVFVGETQKAAARGEAWTPYNKIFDGYLYVGAAARNGGSVPSQEAEPLFQTEKKGDPIEDVGRAR